MARSRIPFPLAAFAALVLSPAAGLAQLPDEEDMPATELWHTAPVTFYVVSAKPEIAASVVLDVPKRQVELYYRHETAERKFVTSRRQPYPTEFWPTDAAFVTPSTLVVVGVTRETGKAVVQEWVFAPPTLDLEAQGGPDVRPAERRSVRTVYEALEPGKGLVRHVCALHGTEDPSVLLQFDDSRGLFGLTLKTGRFRLLASQLPGSDVPTAPALNRPWEHVVVGRFADGGFTYLFRMEDCVIDDESWSSLLFVDENEDGDLDSCKLLGSDDWIRLRYDRVGTWDSEFRRRH